VDLDGTLAVYDGWNGICHIGDPVPAMVERVKAWLAAGWEVRVFTARVASDPKDLRNFRGALAVWLHHAGLPHGLSATNVKDFEMVELWDDRAVTVEANTGKQLAPSNITRGIS
jgi:hypothetical protein